jgi:hypothetical protein
MSDEVADCHDVPEDLEGFIAAAKASVDQLLAANVEEMFTEEHYDNDEQRIYLQFDALMANARESGDEGLMPSVMWASLLAATAIVALARRSDPHGQAV